MISVVLSVGSNCGDRKKTVSEALSWLGTVLMQTVCSEIYETPCAKETGVAYMNAVVKGFYSGNGFELEDLLKEREKLAGRTAECREKGNVPLDIDIVMIDGEVVKPWDYRQKFFRIGFSQIEN